MSPLLSIVAALLVRGGQVQAEVPYAKDIAAFKTQDAKNPPASGQVLFIGSSSFTRWTDAQSYFPNHRILNRAFGGSTLLDVIRYVDDVVTPYRPKQVVIYCGENDLAGDSKLTYDDAVSRFKTLFGLIRRRVRNVPIAYVSMQPSPSRWKRAPKFIAANAAIKEFLSHQQRTAFVDVWPVMLNAQGEPKPEIFGPDNLHMNASGYRLWAPLLEPILK